MKHRKLRIPDINNTRLLLIIILIPCSRSVFTQINNPSIDDFINEYLVENHVPGTACAVIKGDAVIWSEAYGMADIENNIPMTIDRIMNIASISKTITATAIMQLWEKGKSDLEEDINAYLPFIIRNPQFPDKPITIHQLLTHTSSIVDGPAYGNSYSCGDPTISLKDWISNYLTKDGMFYNEMENFLPGEPGNRYQYSNVGFGLLGYIVEEITDKPFNIYCQEYILRPLGMTNSGWFLHEIDISNHAMPYFYITAESKEEIKKNYTKFFPNEKDFAIGKQLASCLYSFPNYPDGLLRTSVMELSYFLAAIMNPGKFNDVMLLKESTIDKMISLQIEGNDSQGLCWHKSNFESLWGHGGGDPGVQTKMFFSPETNIGVIVFQNSSWGNQFEIVRKLYESAINDE
jgi:CubicO group peptidase (beta-lactamase class C family)